MDAAIKRVFESIRQPAYTGDNRCLPCTVLNTVIALGMSVLAGTVLDPIVGLCVLGIALAAIGLRGYLVPGTPSLTKRYLPAGVHRLFGTHAEQPERARTDNAIDLEMLLQDLGIVESCHGEADLCLFPTVEETWYERMDALSNETMQCEQFGARLEIDPDALSIESGETATVVRYEGDRIGTWPSEAALIADLAVTGVLDEQCPEWSTFEEHTQGMIVTALRAFLETCPDCGGAIEGNEETVESCCSTATRSNIECTRCDATLLSQVTK